MFYFLNCACQAPCNFFIQYFLSNFFLIIFLLIFCVIFIPLSKALRNVIQVLNLFTLFSPPQQKEANFETFFFIFLVLKFPFYVIFLKVFFILIFLLYENLRKLLANKLTNGISHYILLYYQNMLVYFQLGLVRNTRRELNCTFYSYEIWTTTKHCRWKKIPFIFTPPN